MEAEQRKRLRKVPQGLCGFADAPAFGCHVIFVIQLGLGIFLDMGVFCRKCTMPHLPGLIGMRAFNAKF